MPKISKKLASEISKAIVAYAAFYEYNDSGEKRRALVYARMVRDVGHVYAMVGLNVKPIIEYADHEDAKDRQP